VGTAVPVDTPQRHDGQPGPIFVVGSMRSGSTMLRLILDSHPSIAIGAETGFMGALLATKKIPNWRYGGEWYGRLGWTESELDARLRTFYTEMFQRHATEQGKARWGEKTPFHTAHMAAMAQVFPDAVFVGIVRHPGAVAVSLRDSFNYAFPDALSYWAATNLDMVRAAGRIGRRFVLCRYEDLVVESEPVLRELMDWLGEPWSPDVLAHHRVQREKGAPRVVDGSTSTRERIDPARAVSWQQALAPSDVDALQEVAPLAGFLGYESASSPERTDPGVVSADRRWLTDGDELAERRHAWSDRVDFDQHPPTLSIDASPEELAARLAQVEQALARTRSRRSVRASEAFRKVQRGRSVQDVRDAWAVLRGLRQ
jgi:hypothetical protein